MVKTKGIEQTMKNYEAGIARAPAKYKEGVEGAANQNENAIAAEDLYAAKVQEAIANSTRVKGLQRSSTADWRKNAIEKGASRIGPGMKASLDKARTGLSEVINTIESTSLSPRSADPMANVDNRVKPIVKALSDMKKR